MDDNYRERQLQRISRANLQRYGSGEIAKSYIKERFHQRRLAIALSLLSSSIGTPRASQVILDVGGVLETAKTLTSMGFKTVTAGYGLTGEWPHGASRIEIDIADGLQFRDEVFDGVFAGEIIEHLFDPIAFIRDVHRVLKVGGVFVITTPNLAALQDRILFLFGRSPCQIDPLHPFRWLHIRPFTYAKLQHILSISGFSATVLKTNEISLHMGGVRIPIPLLDRFLPSLGRSLIVRAKKL